MQSATMNSQQQQLHQDSPLGSAQFIKNLSRAQLHHLQYAVPKSHEPDRFSQFLETPRATPVPKRFTFEAMESRRQQARETRRASRGRRSRSRGGDQDDGRPKRGDFVPPLPPVPSTPPRNAEGADIKRMMDEKMGRASTMSLDSRPSLDLLKPSETVKAMVDVMDWRYYATGACVFLLNLVVAWDATSVSIALPTIATAVGTTALESFWLGIAFLVGAAAFIPLFSILSEILGRKAMLLSALTLFTVGSFIAAISGNLMGLHLGRTVQGIGGGGIIVLSNLIVSDLVEVKDRWQWTAVLGAVWAMGAVTGPLIGNALAAQGQWRWIFWLNLPFSILALLILAFFAQLRDEPVGSIFAKLQSIDWPGLFLLTGSLVSFLLGLTWGGTQYAWSDIKTLLPLQLGIIGLVGFCIWSWYSPFPSIIALDEFLDPTNVAAYFGTFIQGMVVFAILYFLPFYFSIAKPTLTPAGLIAWTMPLAALAGATFFAIHQWNYWRPAVWVGWLLTVIGVALMCLLTRTSSTAMLVGIAIVTGFGTGILYPSLHVASIVTDTADDEKVRIGVTNMTFFQVVGQTLGVAIGVSIFENQLFKNLKSNPLFVENAVPYASDAVALVIRVRATQGGEGSAKAHIADAYVDSMRVIWIVMAALAGLAMLVSLIMQPKEPQRHRSIDVKTLDDGYVV